MADDLATLRSFGAFQDEGEMRLEVAARVVAQSSRAALEDEEKVAQAWRDLEEAEHRVSELDLELSEAQLTAAQDAAPLPSSTAANASSSSPATAIRRVTDIRFQLNAAKTELKRRDALLRQTQQQVDRRQAARLEEAKRRERAQAAADAQTAATPRTVPVTTHATPPTVITAARSTRHGGASSPAGPGGAPALASPAPSKTATQTTTRVFHGTPRHLSGVTQSEYSGGDVLPSLSRVQVTRADIRSKQRRYQDDSDMTHYMDRIAKRQRLEGIAQKQRQQAATAAASSSSISGVTPSASALAAVKKTEVKAEVVVGKEDERNRRSTASTATTATAAAAKDSRRRDEAAQVKQEPGSEKVTRRQSSATSLKKEEEQEDEEEELVPSIPQPVKTEATPNSVYGSVEASAVIDVDALMEDDDDDAVEAAMHHAATQLHHAGSQSCSQADGSAPATPHQPPTPLSPSSAPQPDILENGDIVVEMEEVTLMPGVHMDATIYSRLLDYQQEGLLWLLSLHARRSGGILGDEMGLGKTIQVAALLNALQHSSMLRGPVLIVTPMTVLRQWLAELHRWAPYLRSCVMHESNNSSSGESTREALLRSVQGTPAVVITTFAAMRAHCGLLQRTGFQYVILDEGHKISNPEAGITLAAKSFTTPHRLILSGSPIQNSLKELWCLFDFVRPGLLGTMNRFVDEFETPIAQSRNVRATQLSLATAVECAKTLQAHIAPYLLRRLKRQVNTKLPPKYERVLRVPLTDQQLEQYVHVLSSPVVQRLFAQTVMYGNISGELNRDGRDSSGSLHVAGPRLNMATRRNNSGLRMESFRLMNQLRQICNHADIYAVQRGADEEDRMTMHRSSSSSANKLTSRGPLRPGQHRSFRSNNPVNLQGSGKLNALLMMLQEWKSFGHRVLVFSQTRMMLDIIENMCEQQSYTYIRMDGATNGHHRQELMDRFNEDASIFVALLTTRVGGIGVNLIGADRVVIFDPDWNPITDVQARERAWRIGQRREVCVYRLITSGSVEEVILRRQLAKMYVTDKVLNDPELQRFFHVQDSFMENFLLGSEYEARVPLDKRYLLTAHELHKPTTGARGVSNNGSSASARQGGTTDETLGDYGAAEFNTDSDTSDSEDDDGGEGVTGTAKRRAAKASKVERDFGLLVPVKDEGVEEDANDTATVLGAAAGATAKGKERGETRLLQSLVDHQDVVVAGSDRVAHRLARQKAQEMLRRVASQQSVTETMREQQKQFSLLSALEDKKAAEAADREDKKRYYKEEMAAAAAAKRRRE